MNLFGPAEEFPAPEPGAKGRFAADVQAQLSRLKEMHDALDRSYSIEMFEQLEQFCYSIGSWFNEARSLIWHTHWRWVNRSAACQAQVAEVIRLADQAAVAFQHSTDKNYRRAECQRHVQNLIHAIHNLLWINEQRKEDQG